MTEFTRRGFLGGMLSLLAIAQIPTFVPSPAEGNWMPRIFGNGRDYDGEGLQALFDGKDVILPSDKIGIRGFAMGRTTVKGIIFHHGTFVIDREVYTNGRHLEIESAIFDGRQLKDWEAFFNHPQRYFLQDDKTLAIVGKARWLRDSGSLSVDVGDHQYSIHNTWMSEAIRHRPTVRPDFTDGLTIIKRSEA